MGGLSLPGGGTRFFSIPRFFTPCCFRFRRLGTLCFGLRPRFSRLRLFGTLLRFGARLGCGNALRFRFGFGGRNALRFRLGFGIAGTFRFRLGFGRRCPFCFRFGTVPFRIFRGSVYRFMAWLWNIGGKAWRLGRNWWRGFFGNGGHGFWRWRCNGRR